MKKLNRIPTSKIERASKLITTGAKVGMNYVKYYGDKLVNPEEEAKQRLNESNAEDIYDSLKQLKGSALKVAQMLSMEKNIMPQAYVEKFSLAQFSVPALSAPLVVKTFRQYFGKAPDQLYDKFEPEATNAATIGQVHRAEKDGKKLAVKIQYPGVAGSVRSDLALVKPIAMKMFNIQAKDSDHYFKEVEDKLIEETDYELEVRQSKELSEACQHIPNLQFPGYYENLSSQRVITMDWMEGEHLSEFTAHNTDPEKANRLGQALWDFYMYQIHRLRKVHADPHPGNFLVSPDVKLSVLDFGCVKHIPDEFYTPYFELADENNLQDPFLFKRKLQELEILKPGDSPEETAFFTELFHQLLSLFTQPFNRDVFDFSDEKFFGDIAALGERFAKDTKLRNMNGSRGSKHFIYMNRTFFGLYNLLHDLRANNIEIRRFETL
ncbi:ABC transporter [Fulvitalea axinellae]|uniref:ABC transporter n=1 Tax=Fulvitalea axinellae TaxID=1182444 RepID=A0AAU9DAD7_9BACT|nr:ABC transporter [Fulvitalea axinellae]